MTRHIARCGTAAAGICLGAMFVVAQAGAGASASAASQTGREDGGGPVTVTGCLIEFSNPTGGSALAGENSRSADGEQFVLANVRPASASPSSADMPGSAGASGTAGSGATPQSTTGGATDPGSAVPTSPNPAAGSAANRYLVLGLQTDELRKLVMRQVEVSGTLEPRRRSAPESASRSADEVTIRPAPARGRALSDLPRLDASSIRMIAGACTPQGS
jgi:hypothetical protein